MARSDRNSIFLEDGVIISQQAHADEQFILRVQAPRCARYAQAGSFAHVSCDPLLPMRRPLSIMRVDAAAGWIEFLYKIIGAGLRLLALRKPGETLSLLGPIGRPFELHPAKSRPLLIGGGVGIPPMIFLADTLRSDSMWNPTLFMGSEIPFPFELCASQLHVATIDERVNQNLQLLEDWRIPARLASLQDYPGCFSGYVTTLARQWLESHSATELDTVEIFACGPTPMLRACAELATEFNVPAQVSLEEHMACAVGGCAGCAVEVRTAEGPAMQRVCVDGPVFDAAAVFPAPVH